MSSNADTRPVLVTGANGLVGSRLVARLSVDHRVIAVGRGPAREAIAGLLALEYLDLDLRSSDELRDLVAVRAPSAVFHAAASTDVDGCERDPVQAFQLNVRAVEAVALGCREVGAKLVALSTDYVFDGEAGPYGEDDRPNPRGVYALTKHLGEQTAQLLAPDALVCRVAVVFSGRKGMKRTFAGSAAENLLAGREVKAFCDQCVSPTLADHAAALCIGVWNAGASGLFHCAGGEAVTRVEFCQRLARKLGADERLVVPVSLHDVKLPAPRPRSCGLKIGKTRALLGAWAVMSLDVALDRFVAERTGAST